MRRASHTVIAAGAMALAGCIVEFMPDVDVGHQRLLVVDGTIGDGDTEISLNWSESLHTVGSNHEPHPATGARLRVESEPGGSFESVEILEAVQIYDLNGNPVRIDSVPSGRYRIRTGALDDNTRYRLNIAIEGEEYVSGWRQPRSTPPIEKMEFHTEGNQLQIRVDLTGEDDGPRHYLWSYEETWETQADILASIYVGRWEGDYDEQHNLYDLWYGGFTRYQKFSFPNGRSPFYHCWKYNNSNELLLATTEALTTNALRDHFLFEFPVYNDRLSQLYHLKVYQQAVGEDAYHYLSTVKKNTDETGTIFAPIPSEMKGNLVCTTTPEIDVIGFVEVSRRVERELYLGTFDSPYAPPRSDCEELTDSALENLRLKDGGGAGLPWYTMYTVVSTSDLGDTYAKLGCVDCRKTGGTKIRPSWWPNDHY